MIHWLKSTTERLWGRFLQGMQEIGEPFLLLGARLVIGDRFLDHPLARLDRLFSGGWHMTVELFGPTHTLPLLSHPASAAVYAAVEVTAAALLVLGLLTRPAAFLLALLAVVIVWSGAPLPHGADPMLLKFLLLGLLIVLGGGAFSIDRLTRRD